MYCYQKRKGINVLMNSTMDVGLYTSYSFGCLDNISVSHLQITNDTLLLGGKVRSQKLILSFLGDLRPKGKFQ